MPKQVAKPVLAVLHISYVQVTFDLARDIMLEMNGWTQASWPTHCKMRRAAMTTRDFDGSSSFIATIQRQVEN